MAQVVDGVLVGGDEAADGSQALGERTHDEVDVVLQTKIVANASTLLSEHTKPVGLVNHDAAIVLVLQFNNLGQLGQVTLHGEHAIHNDEFHSLMGKALQHPFQVGHVVVLIMELGGKAKSSSVNDAGMVAVVTNDIVSATNYNGKHSRVDRESRGEAQGVVLMLKGGKFFLQLYMNVEGSIKESASGTSGTIFLQSLLGSGNHPLIGRKTRIGVGAKHKHFVALHGNLWALLACYGSEIGIHSLGHILLGFAITLVSFL